MTLYRASFYLACASLVAAAARLSWVGTIGPDLGVIIGLIAILLMQLKAYQ